MEANVSIAEHRGKDVRGGFWRCLKHFLIRELNYFKGIGIAGLLGTLLVAYFQNISAYEAKVAAQAKDDMSAAAQAFAEASTALSTALSLQQRLINVFYSAVPNDIYKDDNAYLTKSARSMYKDYMETYASFHENYNLLARKAEIYLDWPSDKNHDAVASSTPTTDRIDMSLLGEFNFNCENYMPNFENGKTRVPLTDPHDSTDTVVIDWNSAKHEVLTTQYCFEVTHKNLTAALEWASQSTIEPAQWSYLTNSDQATLFKTKRTTNQVLRLNAYMSVAMSEIERIRINYRPKPYLCNVPIARQLMGKRCISVQTAVQ